MNKVEVKLDRKAIGNLLKSAEVKDMVAKVAEGKSSNDQHVKTFVGFDRAKSIIYPNTRKNPK